MYLSLSLASRATLFVILVASPLLLGSNRPLFWSLNGILAGICLALFVAAEWGHRGTSRFSWKVPYFLSAWFLVLLIWMMLQALPIMPYSLSHPLWKAAAESIDGHGALAIAPPMALTAAAWAAPLAIYLVGFRIGMGDKDGRLVIHLMLAVMCAVAIFGYVSELANLNSLGLVAKEAYAGWLTGTFVNRNTAAAFFAMGLAVALGQIMSARHDNGKIPLMPRFAAVVLAVAIPLTGSRGGLLAAAAGAAATAAIGFGQVTLKRSSMMKSGLALAAVAAVGLLALLRRTDNAADSNVGRLSLYQEALSSVATRPIAGQGAGSYEVVEPLFHRAETPSNLLWSHAHSGLLEAISTLGIPMAAVLCCGLVAVIVYLARSYGGTSGEHASTILSAAGGLIAASTHAIFDFSLQTQSVALYAAVLAGLGTGRAAALSVRPDAREAARHETITASMIARSNNDARQEVTIP